MSDHNRRPFRFGVVAARATSGAEWLSLAKRIESLGYSALLMPDRPGRVLSSLPALAVAATATDTLRVGTFVLANGLRNPAVLASDCATLDFLSNGRFELGLGTGVSEEDFQRAGIEYGRPGERITRLEETLRILNASFSPPAAVPSLGPIAASAADYYPPTVQRPRPPILIAGAGPRVLALAAREADIVAFGLGPRASEADFVAKIALVRQAAGERFAALELSLNLAAIVSGSVPPSVRQRVRFLHHVDLDELVQAESPFVVSGDATAMSEQLLERRDRLGVSYVTVPFDQMDAFAPVVARLAGK